MRHTTPRVADYMTEHPYSIGMRQTLAEAYALMRSHCIAHLPVVSGGKPVGLLADPDVRTLEQLKRCNLEDVLVEEFMTPMPYAVTADAPLREVAKEMAAQKCGAAVVMRDASVVGVFTAFDALRALADVLGSVRARQ